MNNLKRAAAFIALCFLGIGALICQLIVWATRSDEQAEELLVEFLPPE